MSTIILHKGREKSLARRHPWVFSEAIKHVEGKPGAGDTVDVLAANGAFLGRGAYSPDSQITARIWTFDPAEQVNAGFFSRRLEAAVRVRKSLLQAGGCGCRLVNAESDGLPGVIADQYGDFIVCQFLSRGAEAWKTEIVKILAGLASAPAGVYERSDVDVRAKEGLPSITGVLHGAEPPELIEIKEGACRFLVDVRRGHKTGFYLDQRDNRACLTDYAYGAEVLNCFSYTGGFGVAALAGGAAHVVNIDSSAEALELGKRNVELNGCNPDKVENIAGDVFQVLRKYRDSRRQFDIIILDPPKFAGSRAQLDQASRGYKDINLLALKLLRPGGLLFTFSCSGLMPTDLFQKIVADSALDAGRAARILRRLSQATDHPTSLNFPEGTYLKGLLCQIEA